MNNVPNHYSPLEERLNVLSHALGLVLAVVGTVLLLIKAFSINSTIYYVAFSIYGLSMITLYTASTLYHNSKGVETRKRLKVFDHASIYLLIAGTATPLMLICLRHSHGLLFGIITWCVALGGIVFKLFFTGRFKLASTLGYVGQGLIMLAALIPAWNTLPIALTSLIIWGGIAYIVGAVLYMIKRIPFNHAIFHILCLVGSTLHFIAIYKYV